MMMINERIIKIIGVIIIIIIIIIIVKNLVRMPH